MPSIPSCQRTTSRHISANGLLPRNSRWRFAAVSGAALPSSGAPPPASSVFLGKREGRVWRPHVDDVERISRGQGAKVRGTGSRDVPHRLNAEEREAFLMAQKKVGRSVPPGRRRDRRERQRHQQKYLTVRGTGYRRERKGCPLPNIWRQWNDARAAPCLVIEQDASAGSDCLVIDLSTLRQGDTSQVRDNLLSLATSLGARPVPEEQRSASDVPFTVIPLWSTSRSSLPKDLQQRFDRRPTITIAAAELSQHQQQQPLAVAPSRYESGPRPALGTESSIGRDPGPGGADESTTMQMMGADEPPRSSASPPSLEELQRRLEDLSLLLEEQRVIVRHVKERVALSRNRDHGAILAQNQLLDTPQMQQDDVVVIRHNAAAAAATSSKETGGAPPLPPSPAAAAIATSVNDDPEVVVHVRRLLDLKRAVAVAEDALGDARAEAAVEERRAASVRRAALWDVFSPPPPLTTSEAPPPGPDPGAIDRQHQTRFVDGITVAAAAAAAAVVSVSCGSTPAYSSHPAADLPSGSWGARDLLGPAYVPDGESPAGGPDGPLDPFRTCATWQLPTEALFFTADRATIKTLAKHVVAWLQSMAHW